MKTPPAAKWLLFAILLYCATSFAHFAHNAEFLTDYPNLPAWLTRAQVYLTWLGITALGVIGYLLHRLGWRLVGLAVLAVYAGIGFDGLLHYTRAPFSAHTAVALSQPKRIGKPSPPSRVVVS